VLKDEQDFKDRAKISLHGDTQIEQNQEDVLKLKDSCISCWGTSGMKNNISKTF